MTSRTLFSPEFFFMYRKDYRTIVWLGQSRWIGRESSRSRRASISIVVVVDMFIVVIVVRHHVVVMFVIERCPFRRLRIILHHHEKTWSIDFNMIKQGRVVLTNCWISYRNQCAKEFFFSLSFFLAPNSDHLNVVFLFFFFFLNEDISRRICTLKICNLNFFFLKSFFFVKIAN